jgi:hypothetical protein
MVDLYKNKTSTMKKINFKPGIFLLLAILSFSQSIKAQDTQPGDTLYPLIEKLNHELNLYKYLKISGYIQAQYQLADTAAISSYAGGNFPSNTNQRFAVRRGRVKFVYAGANSQFVMQLDLTEKGLAAKDAYGVFTDPWTKSLSLTAGLFNRPFGYEIFYSSSLRESPERARIYQILFPGERDGGMMLTFQPPKTSRYNWFKIDAGLFNGTGVASDFDSKKDFIGHLSINRSTSSENLKYGIGLSYYNGGWNNGNQFYYKTLVDAGTGVKGFRKDSTGKAETVSRTYYGADAQLSFSTILGLTTVRGEYLTGIQPGTFGSSASPGVQPTDPSISKADLITGIVKTPTVNSSAVLRNFSGALLYLTQNIGQSKHQIVLKYDYYDPNTKVEGNGISSTGIGSNFGKLSATDIKYQTIGIGYICKMDANVKIMAYYDFVKNETTALSGKESIYTKDLKDNVFTLRIQYKF